MAPNPAVDLAATPLYIDGSWIAGDGASVDDVNPATGEVLAAPASATTEQVDAALAVAARAQVEWRRIPIIERGNRLRALAELIGEYREALAALLVAEVGKPVQQAQAEVDFAIGFIRYHAEWDRRLEGEILAGDVPGETIHLLRAPLGVVAAICPWNFPLAVLCRKLGPALLTGNTVVAKPSEFTPLSTLYVSRLIQEHDLFPAGVFNVVCGAGRTGAALVRSPLTSLVTFTGHRDTGKTVMAQAAGNLTRVSLELGGKAPAIVWKDADLQTAVSAIVQARHTNAGQVCTSAERVLVHRDVLDEFTERYVRSVQALRLGDPIGAVDMGPLVSSAQLDKTTRAVQIALDEGAKLVIGGSRPEGPSYGAGYWYSPTVLTDVVPSMQIMTEEAFGPVTPILGIDGLDEAIKIANDSRYGLSAYLFSQNYGWIMRAVQDLEFGEIYINRTLGESIHAHHSGFKESGIGGEDGKWGLLRYTQIKTAYHHYG